MLAGQDAAQIGWRVLAVLTWITAAAAFGSLNLSLAGKCVPEELRIAIDSMLKREG
jgi:hypothetical protein